MIELKSWIIGEGRERNIVISRLHIIHTILQAASGPSVICNYIPDQSPRYNNLSSKLLMIMNCWMTYSKYYAQLIYYKIV